MLFRLVVAVENEGNQFDLRHSYCQGETLPSGVLLALTESGSGVKKKLLYYFKEVASLPL